MAITISDISYTPNPMVSGKKVTASVKVTADDGVASVKLYTPDFRTLEARETGEGVYTLEAEVPYADPGTYDVTVVVTDKKGDVLRKTVPVNVG